MGDKSKQFLKDADRVSFDIRHRKTIKFNIGRYNQAVEKGMNHYLSMESAKLRLAHLKRTVLNNLDVYLQEFERNVKANGGEVLWAADVEEAQKLLLAKLVENKVKLVVKSKSMTTEEIHVNEVLADNNIESVETDLGEYIVQLAGEKPYHIVTPAMHKSKEDVAKLFHEKFGTPADSTPEFLTNYVRGILRNKFRYAEAGITGANFLVADIGGVALTENEGNGLMSTSMPALHIAIAGIEKVIPSVNDLGLFWSVLAAHGTGQKITAYNTVFTKPASKDSKLIVILLDNGRSKLLANEDQREALACIRCGACLNGCPVYKNVGGYTYESTYSGPIGSVISRFYFGSNEYNHLSFASTLCGKCKEVCPVKIDLPRLLLINRRDAVNEGYAESTERFTMSNWKKIMLSRSQMNMGGGLKNAGIRVTVKSKWGNRRSLPDFASRTFNKQWRKER